MAISVGDLVANLRLDMGPFAAGVVKAQQQMDGLASTAKSTGKKMTSAGKKMTAGVTAPLVGLGVAAFKTSADFQQAMNNVEAVLDPRGALDPSAMVSLREEALRLGSTTVFSAQEAASGMQFLAQAGFSVEETTAAMAGTLALAAAGQLDLAQAADISSNVLSGFGLSAGEADRAADVLALTASKANTSVEQMGEAMSYVAPIAASAGISMEEAAAAIGILGNAGIQGSRAGTTLSGAITKLLKPSKAAAEVMADLGLNVTDAEGALLPFDKIVKQLGDSGATTAQLMEIFGLRAGPGMAALMQQGSGAISELDGLLQNAGGTAQAMADVQMKGAAGAMARMKAAVEALMIALGDSGLLDTITSIAESIGEFATKLSATNPNLLRIALLVAAVAAAIGPLLIVAGLAVQAFGALAGVAAVISAPMLLIPAAIAAVIAAILWLWNTNEGFRDAVIGIWDRITGALQPAFDAFQKFREMLGQGLSLKQIERLGPMMGSVGEGAAKMATFFLKARDKIDEVLAVIKAVVSAFVQKVTEWWAVWGDDITSFAKEAFDTVRGVISSAMDVIQQVIRGVTNLIAALWRTWGETILAVGRSMFAMLGNVIENAWNTIKQVFRGAMTFLKGVFDTFAGLFTGDWSRMWDGVKNIFVGLWQVVEGIFGGIIDSILDVLYGAGAMVFRAVGDIIARMTEPMTKFIADALGIGGDIVDGLIDGLVGAAGKAVEAVVNVVRGIKDAALGFLGIASPSKVFKEIGSDTIAGLTKGIEAGAGEASRAVVNVADTLIGKAKELPRSLVHVAKSSKRWTEILQGQLEQVEGRLSKARAEADRLRDAHSSMVKQVSEKFTTSVFGDADRDDSLIDSLKKQLRTVREFQDALKKVQALGANTAVVERLAQAGPSAMADLNELIAGGKDAVRTVNILQNQVLRESRGIGATAADQMFNAGIAVADGLVAGLESREEYIKGRMVAMAGWLSDTIKSELGIKSPSRVFAAIGGDTVAGLVRGVDASAGSAEKAAQELARRVSDVSPKISAEVQTSMSDAQRRQARLPRMPVPEFRAPDPVIHLAPEIFVPPMQAPEISLARVPMPEPVSAPVTSPVRANGPGSEGSRSVNITVDLDGRTIMRAIGKPLVDEIRLRGAVRTV